MGQIRTSIELVNPTDVELARRSLLDPEDIRCIAVSALVDTGTMHMAINENIQEYLQIPVIGHKRVEMANGQIREYPLVGPLTIRCKGETSNCNAVVLPEDSEPLLGAIPMEEMNFIIDTQRLEVVPNSRCGRMSGFRILPDIISL